MRLFGASIMSVASAKVLKASNEDSLESVVNHLSPLHCLFCCQGYALGDLPHRAYGFLKARGYVDQDSQLLLDEPPYYVSQLLRDKAELDSIGVHDENLRRITVIHELGEDRPK